MASFVGVVLNGPPNALSPERFWAALERNVPRALTPLLVAMREGMPRRSGKLASRPLEVRAERKGDIFGGGVQAAIGAREPYAHLVAFGHRVVARGPTRKGRKLSRAVRAAARTALRNRQDLGQGFVPGRDFVTPALDARGPEVVRLLEKLLVQELVPR